MRVVVTGASGFIGWHLTAALEARGDTVDAWTRVIDITDADAVAAALRRAAPDAVVHLAAQSSPVRSWQEPELTFRVNVFGTLNLLEAARALDKPPRLLIAGSSAEYAESTDGNSIAEVGPTDPDSLYGASKLAADRLAQLYGARYQLDVVRFRPFFLAGPRKTGDVSSDFARRIVAIERGGAPVLKVGNLDVIRDIIDVRDGIAGILTILDSGASGDLYNVCGGAGVSIRQLLDTYRALATTRFDVAEDEALVRAADQKAKIGDPAKLRALGWAPRYDLKGTARAVLDYWRERPPDDADAR